MEYCWEYRRCTAYNFLFYFNIINRETQRINFYPFVISTHIMFCIILTTSLTHYQEDWPTPIHCVIMDWHNINYLSVITWITHIIVIKNTFNIVFCKIYQLQLINIVNFRNLLYNYLFYSKRASSKKKKKIKNIIQKYLLFLSYYLTFFKRLKFKIFIIWLFGKCFIFWLNKCNILNGSGKV